jgi:hypothetical protein
MVVGANLPIYRGLIDVTGMRPELKPWSTAKN